jgi:hypothetical protein
MYPVSTEFTGNLVIDGDNVEVPLYASGKVDTLDIPCPPTTENCPVQAVIDCGGAGCDTRTDREFFDMTFVE